MWPPATAITSGTHGSTAASPRTSLRRAAARASPVSSSSPQPASTARHEDREHRRSGRCWRPRSPGRFVTQVEERRQARGYRQCQRPEPRPPPTRARFGRSASAATASISGRAADVVGALLEFVAANSSCVRPCAPAVVQEDPEQVARRLREERRCVRSERVPTSLECASSSANGISATAASAVPAARRGPSSAQAQRRTRSRSSADSEHPQPPRTTRRRPAPGSSTTGGRRGTAGR